jgi:hypothetical protein
MAVTLQEKLAALDEARRARIAAETDRLEEEYRTLQQLRKVRE